MSWCCLDRPAFVAALVAGCGLSATAHAVPCGAALKGARLLKGVQDDVAWAPTPSPVAIGRRFSIDIVVCPRSGAEAPGRVGVDAQMPEHGHGMNYVPSVVAQGGGRWRAEGLLLHMAGRWELSIVLHRGAQAETLRHDLQLK
jgi:hypothetical protein